jgi:DNA-binding CsgD family transcriptional regulator
MPRRAPRHPTLRRGWPRSLATDETVGGPHLTKREREVLLAWLQTESKDLVAQNLSVEAATVSTHLQRIRAEYAAMSFCHSEYQRSAARK